MSYILNALRKAEQERNLGQVPQLQTVHAPWPPLPRGNWPKILLGVVLLINGLALTAVFYINYGETVDLVKKISSATRAESAARGQKPSQVDFSSAENAKLPSSESANPIPAAAITRPAARAAETPSFAMPDGFSQPWQSSQGVASSTPVSPRPTFESPEAIPDLHLDIHVYDETRANSFVVINSQHYREGERLQEGPLLESIRHDGAVLIYQGHRFRLPVGP